jgi:hypothetical protein
LFRGETQKTISLNMARFAALKPDNLVAWSRCVVYRKLALFGHVLLMTL